MFSMFIQLIQKKCNKTNGIIIIQSSWALKKKRQGFKCLPACDGSSRYIAGKSSIYSMSRIKFSLIFVIS